MELARPRLANEETAIATVIDKDIRKKVGTTNTIDRITRSQEELIELFNFGGRNGFSKV